MQQDSTRKSNTATLSFLPSTQTYSNTSKIKWQASPETTRNEMNDNLPSQARWKTINFGFFLGMEKGNQGSLCDDKKAKRRENIAMA
jgi:hypothetical protein